MFNRPLRAALLIALFVAPASLVAGGKESATFRATVTGEISGGPQSHVNSVTSATTSVVIRLMPMDLSLLTTAVVEGEACFWQVHYEGPLTVEQDRNGNAMARYWFEGRARDGVTEVKYLLEMRGVLDDPSNWLPAPGTTAYMNVRDWVVAAESKGQGRVACSGNGTVTATRIAIERLP